MKNYQKFTEYKHFHKLNLLFFVLYSSLLYDLFFGVRLLLFRTRPMVDGILNSKHLFASVYVVVFRSILSIDRVKMLRPRLTSTVHHNQDDQLNGKMLL